MVEETKGTKQAVEGDVLTTIGRFQLPTGRTVSVGVSTASLQDLKRASLKVRDTLRGLGQGFNKLSDQIESNLVTDGGRTNKPSSASTIKVSSANKEAATIKVSSANKEAATTKEPIGINASTASRKLD